MTTILVNNPIHEAGLRQLREEGYEVLEGPLEGDELDEALSTTRGMIVRSGTTVTAAMLEKAPYLEVIGRAGVGVDNIDLDACEERDVVVFNTPSAISNAVAELAIAHMLSVVRHLPRAIPATREGRWVKSQCRGLELNDRTLGVVGLGRIGARVAELGEGLGMTVEGFDPFVDEARARELGLAELHDEVTELASNVDVVTVHTPLTPETEGLIGETFFETAEDLVVVNTARGGVVDEDALVDALEEGTVLGAGLDVFETEPPGKHRLFDHPRVSATPHIGAQTDEAQRKAATLAADGITGTLEGTPPGSRIV